MVYETQTESSHHYGDVYWCCNWFLCRWIEQSLGNIAMKVRGKTFSSLVLHQTICRLQCLGSSCNICVFCISVCTGQHHTDPYDWRNVRHAALVTEVPIRSCRQACFSFIFLNLGLKFNCVSAVSAVAQVSDGTDVWITAWHLSWKYEN